MSLNLKSDECNNPITVGLTFESKDGLSMADLDLHVFITDADYKALSKNHWLWYYNLTDPDEAVKFSAGLSNGYQKSVQLVLSKLPDDVKHVILCANSFEENIQKQDLSLIQKIHIDILDNFGKELVNYEFGKVQSNSNSIVLLDFKRIGENSWKTAPYGNGNNMNLIDLCSSYGISIKCL